MGNIVMGILGGAFSLSLVGYCGLMLYAGRKDSVTTRIVSVRIVEVIEDVDAPPVPLYTRRKIVS